MFSGFLKQRRLSLIMKQLSVALAGLSLLMFFQNCSEQKINSGASSTTVVGAGNINGNTDDATGVVTQTGGPNCRDEIKSATFPIRMLFIVDTSGSNVTSEMSDPQRQVRKGSIERFYNTYSAKQNFAWAFNIFSGSTSTALIGSSNNPIFGNSSAMVSAISAFNGIADAGNTPYQQAMQLGQQAIQNDTARPNGSKYIVVFMSDGLPNPDRTQTELNGYVTSLVNTLGSASVSFNAVYYGQSNATASNRLRQMAQVGGGNFLDTNANPSGNAFLITDLVQIPGVNCN